MESKLMAMDEESFVARWKRRARPKDLLARLTLSRIADYFVVEPEGVLPPSAPVDWSKPGSGSCRSVTAGGIITITSRTA